MNPKCVYNLSSNVVFLLSICCNIRVVHKKLRKMNNYFIFSVNFNKLIFFSM